MLHVRRHFWVNLDQIVYINWQQALDSRKHGSLSGGRDAGYLLTMSSGEEIKINEKDSCDAIERWLREKNIRKDMMLAPVATGALDE